MGKQAPYIKAFWKRNVLDTKAYIGVINSWNQFHIWYKEYVFGYVYRERNDTSLELIEWATGRIEWIQLIENHVTWVDRWTCGLIDRTGDWHSDRVFHRFLRILQRNSRMILKQRMSHQLPSFL
jgi:hypothetical protein